MGDGVEEGMRIAVDAKTVYKTAAEQLDKLRTKNGGLPPPVRGGGAHYKQGGIEPLIFIEANNLPFAEASVVKYITRWRLKDGVADLRKVIFYTERLLQLEGEDPESAYEKGRAAGAAEERARIQDGMDKINDKPAAHKS